MNSIRHRHLPVILVLTANLAGTLPAAIIGTNPPAQALTGARVAGLPGPEQAAWKQYLKHSDDQLKADQAFLGDELRRRGLREASVPPSGRSFGWGWSSRSAAWYGSDEARRIADIMVSFQTPAGGWSKNLNLTAHPRAPGEGFAPNNDSRYPAPSDNDATPASHWNYVGTFDNNATITQLRFLAKIIAAAGTNDVAPYRASFRRGLDYIIAAQYPNGGWPQVWPLEGGYHDAITYNDNAMINILNLLRDVVDGQNEFAFVPAGSRAAAAASLRRGLDCLLATQIVVNGRRTAWCQQHDALTLQPASARNYEMPAACAPESADILRFLMRLPDPPAGVVTAVHAGAAWLEKTRIRDVAFRSEGDEGRRLVSAPGSESLWARYYEIGTDRPLFGDRDKTIHDTVEEISRERRRGYAWYSPSPGQALEQYADWSKTHPAAPKAGK
jgi:PelA/Pel-15E family pectate lyase